MPVKRDYKPSYFRNRAQGGVFVFAALFIVLLVSSFFVRPSISSDPTPRKLPSELAPPFSEFDNATTLRLHLLTRLPVNARIEDVARLAADNELVCNTSSKNKNLSHFCNYESKNSRWIIIFLFNQNKELEKISIY